MRIRSAFVQIAFVVAIVVALVALERRDRQVGRQRFAENAHSTATAEVLARELETSVIPVCSGQPLAGAPELGEGDNATVLVVFDSGDPEPGTVTAEATPRIPYGWTAIAEDENVTTAERPDQVQLVACMYVERETLNTCGPYVPEGSRGSIDWLGNVKGDRFSFIRMHYRIDVHEAHTGKLLHEHTIRGSAPDGYRICPDKIGKARDRYGTRADQCQPARWLARFAANPDPVVWQRSVPERAVSYDGAARLFDPCPEPTRRTPP